MMNTSDTATATTTSHHHDPPLLDDDHQTITTTTPPPPPPDDDHQTITTTTTSTTTREEEYLDSFPLGYRFMPTDQELFHYLFLRYHKQTLPPNRFNEIILYDHHPAYLTSPGKGRFKAYENKEWYFFTPRDRRYPNGVRPRRSAGGGDDKGYWKATGADRKIYSEKDKLLGSKKTLVFYEGKAPKGIKTSWVMNEFTLEQTSIQKNSRPDMLLDDSVLCRIHIKEEKKSTTTRSGSRKRKSVSLAEEENDDDNDHSSRKRKSVSLAEEDDDDNNDHSQEEEEEEEGEEEEDHLSVRGETETDVYNDMEDDHLICSDYDSIVDQYYPNTDHDLDHILMNNINSSSIMGPVYSSTTTTTTTSTVVHGGYGAANILPILQTSSHPSSWVTEPILNEYSYMQDISGIAAAPDMVSMSSTHDTHNINIGEQDDDYELMNLLPSLFPDGQPPLPPNQQWMNSLSPILVPDGHPPPIPSNEQWMNSLAKFVPAGHKVLFPVPQGYSLPPPQMPPQMPAEMPPQMQQQGYYHQYSSSSSSSWADSNNNNNIDGSSSSGINKLHDECHMAVFSKGTKRRRFNKEYPESFNQTSFSQK